MQRTIGHLTVGRDETFVTLVKLYLFFTPILVIHLNDDIAVGAPDFLAVFGFFALLAWSRRLWIDAAGIFYTIFTLFAVFSTVHIVEAGEGLLKTISIFRIPIIFMPYLLTVQIRSWRRDELETMYRLFIISGLIAIVLGMAFYMLGMEIREGTQRIWYKGQSVARASGVTGNTADYGHVISLWFAAAVVYLYCFRSRLLLIWLPFICAIAFAAIALSSSRAAAAGIIIFLLISMFSIFGRSMRASGVIYILFLLLTVSVSSVAFDYIRPGGEAFSIDGFIQRSVERLNVAEYLQLGISDELKQKLGSGRFDTWPIIIDLILQRPIMGYGFKQVSGVIGISSDNSVLSSMLDFGVFGGASFLLFWCYLFFKYIYAAITVSHRYMIVFAFVVLNFAIALTIDVYSMWYSMPLFLVLVKVMEKSIQLVVEERRARAPLAQPAAA